MSGTTGPHFGRTPHYHCSAAAAEDCHNLLQAKEVAPSAFKAMLTAEQPAKAERGSESSMYQVAWQACKPVEGHLVSPAAENAASTLLWTSAGAPNKHRAILQVPKGLSGAAACVSVTMRQAQALQAIMQQAGERQSDFSSIVSPAAVNLCIRFRELNLLLHLFLSAVSALPLILKAGGESHSGWHVACVTPM